MFKITLSLAFLLSLSQVSAFAQSEVPEVEFPEMDQQLYVEALIERHITPGQEQMIEYNRMYPLISLPIQITTHPKITKNFEQLQIRAKAAITAAKAQEPDLLFSPDGVITVHTFVRRTSSGAEQKFWLFTVGYHKWEKSNPPGERVDVAHFLAGAYLVHEGKQVFPLQASPVENLNFLATFAIKDGRFNPKQPQSTP